MLKVIGGAWKGRRLALPRGGAAGALRPTSARVREAVFDLLGVEGATFLDLFAGTGAVGIEALSRGAARAVLVERDRRVLACLRRNLGTVGAGGRADVVEADVEAWAPPVGVFDAVFADPPYDEAAYAAALAAAAVAAAPGADVVLERARRHAAPRHPDLDPVKAYRHGDTVLERYRRRG